MTETERSNQSPLIYQDKLDLLKEIDEAKKEIMDLIIRLKESPPDQKPLLMDISTALKYTKRSRKTISKHCEVVDFGFNGKHLFSKNELDAIKKE